MSDDLLEIIQVIIRYFKFFEGFKQNPKTTIAKYATLHLMLFMRLVNCKLVSGIYNCDLTKHIVFHHS